MASNDVGDFNTLTLETFKTWSFQALKVFLHLRNKSVDGTFDELAARAFVAHEEKLEVDSSKELIERQNLADYKSKLSVGNGDSVPDPFTIASGWLDEKAMMLWPTLKMHDITDYLRMKTPTELYDKLMNEYKQGKAYRYYAAGWVKEVKFHNVSDHSDVCIMATKVTPTMRLRQPPYEVWAIVEKDKANQIGGKIYSAYCTCTAGLQGSCNHVLGLLFRAEAAASAGLTNPSCTSKPCGWVEPKNMNFEPQHPIKLCEQKWFKQDYFHCDDDDFHDSVLERSLNYSCMSEDQQQNVDENMLLELGTEMRKLLPNSCFSQMFDSKPMPSPVVTKCHTPVIDIAIERATSGETDINDFVKDITLTTKEIEDIERATVNQSNCEEWSKQRKCRITASNFHRVSSKVNNLDLNPNVKNLVKHIAGVHSPPQSDGMRHGISTEPKAKMMYKKIMKKKHRHFTASDSGLVICHDYPFLGASPDLCVSCVCHGRGLCEIKCPYKTRHEKPSVENYGEHFAEVDGVPKLSKTSGHYYQIQGQMGVLNVKYCDCFVYTVHGYLLDRVYFDEQFWSTLLSQLRWFWMTHVGPSILKGQFIVKNAIPEDISVSYDHTYKLDCNVQPSDSIQNIQTVAAVTASTVLKTPPYDIGANCFACKIDIAGDYMQCGSCFTCYHESCLAKNGSSLQCLFC